MRVVCAVITHLVASGASRWEAGGDVAAPHAPSGTPRGRYPLVVLARSALHGHRAPAAAGTRSTIACDAYVTLTPGARDECARAQERRYAKYISLCVLRDCGMVRIPLPTRDTQPITALAAATPGAHVVSSPTTAKIVRIACCHDFPRFVRGTPLTKRLPPNTST